MFTGFAGYLLLRRSFAPPTHLQGVKVRTMVRALLPAFTMLVLANGLRKAPPYYVPYLAALAAVTAFSLDKGAFRLERYGAALGLGILAWAFVAVAPWARGMHPGTLLAILGIAMAVSALNVMLELRGEVPVRPREWSALRFVLSLAAAGAALGAPSGRGDCRLGTALKGPNGLHPYQAQREDERDAPVKLPIRPSRDSRGECVDAERRCAGARPQDPRDASGPVPSSAGYEH